MVEIRELDFSEFHDLMHYPFTRYCWHMPGGPRRHLALWWEYKARAYVMCRIGRHEWCNTYRHHKPVFDMCWHCGKTRQ